MAPAPRAGHHPRRMDESAEGGNVERDLRAGVAVEDEAGLDPEWPAPSPPVRPPLRRRAQGKVVAGVAGGLADHFGIPALLLRIPLAIAGLVSALVLWNVLTEEGGTIDPSDGLPGLIVLGSIVSAAAYGVLWIVLPRDDVTRSPAGRFTDRYPGIRSVPGFVLLTIGGAILADRLGIWQPDLVLAAALIALGIWLFRRDAAARPDPRVADRRPDETVIVEGTAPIASPGVTRVVRPPRERSPLGWITFGIALLVVSLAAIWTSLADDAAVHRAVGLSRISVIPAIGLLVLAAGLLVSSAFGRARWLIVPALLVLPVLLVSSVVRLPFDGAFGDSFLRPGPAGDNEELVRRNALGSIYVDLARLRGRSDLVRELELSTALGTITVVVPFDAHVRVDAFTGLGTLGFETRQVLGLEASDSATLEPRRGDGATLIVHAEVGLGDVYVLRQGATMRDLREIRREERHAEREEKAA
jgi:phage shock protein PspC (stress-responsive transcriptional regulator)